MAQRPSELAERISNKRKPTDGIMREMFRLPIEAARVKAREIIRQAPQAFNYPQILLPAWHPARYR